MNKYRIVPKRDFGTRGYWRCGEWISSGFVVTLNGVNAMPAAAWFLTIREALQAIRVWEHVKHDSDRFWKLLYRVNGTTKRNRNEDRRAVHRVGYGRWWLMPTLKIARHTVAI